MKNINRKNQSNYLTINIVVLFCCYFSLSMSKVSICFSLIVIYKGAIVTYQDPMRTARLLRPLCADGETKADILSSSISTLKEVLSGLPGSFSHSVSLG